MLLFLICAVPFLFGASCQAYTDSLPKAESGFLDLSQWNFDSMGSVRLIGDWDFFPGVLADPAGSLPPGPLIRHVPGLWNQEDGGLGHGLGAGSYQLRLVLPPRPGTLGIRISTTATSYELFVNGISVAAAGRPGLDASKAIAAYRPSVNGLDRVPGLDPNAAVSQTLDLLVHVSNFEYRAGGLWRAFVLGRLEHLQAAKEDGDIFVYLFSGAVLAIALNSLFLFLFRKQEKSYLYFAIFGLVAVARTLCTGEYLITKLFATIPFGAVIHLEYLSANIIVPIGVLFVSELFPGEMRWRGRLWFLAPYLPFVLLSIFAPLPLLTRSVFPLYVLVPASLVAAFVFVAVRAVRHKRPHALPLLIGMGIIVLAGLNDSLYSAFVINTGNYLVFALAIFIVIQAMVLARRTTLAFSRSEQLSRELGESGSRLEKEIANYAEAQKNLQKALADKETYLKEIHHRVKNSLQLVSSIVSLQGNRAKDPAVAELFETMRSRIRSISLVHEKLHGATDDAMVDLEDYCSDLIRQIVGIFGLNENVVRVSMAAGPISARISFCIDFGLILSELISNALKYAVLPRGSGLVAIAIGRENDIVTLSMHDNGPGFPPGFDAEAVDTLGLRIVSTILRGRRGVLSFHNDGGAWVDLRLPLPDQG